MITVFCCQRSAMVSARMALSSHAELPRDMRVVEVPCSGEVGVERMLEALAEGSRGVLVLGCHSKACANLCGNERASKRADYGGRLLGEIGLEPGRIGFANIGPNMPGEFARLVWEFAARLDDSRALPQVSREVSSR